MTELAEIFAELGIAQYLQEFLDQGFDTWDTILDITESDFDALGVKLGHRRKLQRRIANSRGVSADQALRSGNTPTDDRSTDDQKPSVGKHGSRDVSSRSHGAKRKYRRHPKPDENAPERPPSAYVIFSNKMREELKGKTLSFTEIAKLVGENWQILSLAEKDVYDQQASFAKEKYKAELAEYKKTPMYQEYATYLTDFKARHAHQHQTSALDSSKRPKLELQHSAASSDSSTSAHSDTPASYSGFGSAASSGGRWPSQESQTPPHLSELKQYSAGSITRQASPSIVPPPVVTGYRTSMPHRHSQHHAWKDSPRDDKLVNPALPPLTNPSSQRRSSLNGASPADQRISPDQRNVTGSLQHAHRTGQNHTLSRPPSLPSIDSTTGMTTSSSVSTGSSVFYSPRTPLEPSLDRSIPIPVLYQQKSSGYDNIHALPPLHPPSLSPQASISGLQQSPNGIHVSVDFPSSIPPIRTYIGTGTNHIVGGNIMDPRYHSSPHNGPPDLGVLDPVSALLRAGEIVDRQTSPKRPPTS